MTPTWLVPSPSGTRRCAGARASSPRRRFAAGSPGWPVSARRHLRPSATSGGSRRWPPSPPTASAGEWATLTVRSETKAPRRRSRRSGTESGRSPRRTPPTVSGTTVGPRARPAEDSHRPTLSSRSGWPLSSDEIRLTLQTEGSRIPRRASADGTDSRSGPGARPSASKSSASRAASARARDTYGRIGRLDLPGRRVGFAPAGAGSCLWLSDDSPRVGRSEPPRSDVGAKRSVRRGP